MLIKSNDHAGGGAEVGVGLIQLVQVQGGHATDQAGTAGNRASANSLSRTEETAGVSWAV